MSCHAAPPQFQIGIVTTVRWAAVFRQTGATSPKPEGGDTRSRRIEAHRAVIPDMIEPQKDATLIELSELLRRDHGVSFAPSTLWLFIDRHAISFERQHTPVSRSSPTWQPGAGHGSKLSLTSILDGPMNRTAFQAYIGQDLVPTLRRRDRVILDNLPAHKGADVRRAVKAAGVTLRYLPPYLPNFGPIENAFSKLQTALRKAAAQTIDGLWHAIRDALTTITTAECENYLTAAGYELE